jgi:hypothetical protein
MVLFEDQQYDGFYYNFQPGVTATCLYQQYGHGSGNAQKVPPVFWQTSQALPGISADLFGGVTPTSTYGPESIP